MVGASVSRASRFASSVNTRELGRFLARIDELGIADRTIRIFLTDKGAARGAGFDTDLDGRPEAGFNAGMRGRKSSALDGGHRVLLFVHWPGGRLGDPMDIGDLAAHIDILPTLVDFCGLDRPAGPRFDGFSPAKLMRRGPAGQTAVLPDSQGRGICKPGQPLGGVGGHDLAMALGRGHPPLRHPPRPLTIGGGRVGASRDRDDAESRARTVVPIASARNGTDSDYHWPRCREPHGPY